MKVKLKNTIFENGFIASLSRLMDQPVSPAQGFQLAKFAKQVEEKSKLYFSAKDKMIKRLGEEDPKEKGKFRFSKKNQPILQKEYIELQNLEEEYDVEPIGLKEDISISTKDLLMLEDILAK